MSNYDDPRWYEEDHEHIDFNQLPPQEPTYRDFGATPPLRETTNHVSPQQRLSMHYTPPPRNRGRRVFGQVVVITALLIVTFFGGWFSHQALDNPFVASNQSQSYAQLLQQAWLTIDQHYVDRKAVNYKQMSYQAIRAMLDVLHDKGHTRFLTPQDVKSDQQQLSGTYTGIGVYLSQDEKTKQFVITSTIPGSPAEKAGFKHGDIIIAVNGMRTAGKDLAGLHALIQGPAGTPVSITVQRPSTQQTLVITVTRAEIRVPNVLMHYIAEDHIAHIQLLQFADGVSGQLKNALLQAKKIGATSIILDLRDDPGGYLQEAIDTASEFLASGKVLLEQDSTGQRTPYEVSGDAVDTQIPIVVLVNNGTASAAEIVSGALQDNHRAIIIGQQTFGTGTVLQDFTLSDGSVIRLGIREWLTPDGQFIRDKGITPDIKVALPQDTSPLEPYDENSAILNEEQILSSGDAQLVSAIQYLETHKTTLTGPSAASTTSHTAEVANQMGYESALFGLDPRDAGLLMKV